MKQLKCSLLLTVLLAAVVVGANAQSNVNQIVMTEHSSTTLSVTYNGGAITAHEYALDLWQFQLPATSGISAVAWLEPGGTTVNDVYINANALVQVQSDVSLATSLANGYGVPFANDSPVTTLAGVATFNDLGDTATAPDAAPSGLLLLISLAALAMARFHVRRRAW